jgi:RimJ/RimL family protein N-acetyltransferase
LSVVSKDLPCTFRDKHNTEIVIDLCCEKDCEQIVEMYWHFEPKDSYQGIPPRTREKTTEWVQVILRDNMNLMARCGNQIIGHASLLQIRENDLCEYLIFVHQDYQNRGIGTKLTEAAKRCAADQGYQRIWLSVNLYNSRAIHVYTKTGFRFISPVEAEREMVLELHKL